MDPEAFLEIANQVSKLNMFPYFEAAHCLITCMYVKEDLSSGAHLFSRKHPLACWVSCMLSIFGGYILASFLLGEPILACLKNSNSLLLATGSWYIIFYTPFDFGYKVFKFLPVKIILAVMKEIIRCKKVHDGVVHAAKIYPNGYLIMIIIGTIKGNGSAFLKIIERLLRGVWTPSAVELMQLSFPTKACIAASIIFVLDKKTDIISAPHALVYFGLVIFFAYFKLSSMLLGIHDPFVPFENLFCALFLGGIWDTLARLLTPATKGDQTSVKPEPAKTESAKKKE
ncbi:trimeric intracellular cation channel type 1B.1 [Parasteatoda tepidariorum]|uniref:trimeric intracellular cation channel type 1B.1 n=1 Tax=Parasteatoda tepidariorum TaxID=114398 RepID=UPI00077F87D1|nr:trimeric intracellular cation channel type 1B.1 [Parasteatoda tepidariorum]XP_042909962.1 trimeric intracellular cation channel type 1B.1 [Parasteatoda tepidariorum]